MRIFLSIKFPGDDRNRQEVEGVIEAIEQTGAEVFCFRRDAEEWGKNEFTPSEMMKSTLDEIDQVDFLIAEIGDWPIGVGVEVGYARGRGIPVICICREDQKIPSTVSGLAEKTIRYRDTEDLGNQLGILLSKR
jgi:nucleoside 2-deoxyribosyltransferase